MKDDLFCIPMNLYFKRIAKLSQAIENGAEKE
jgi:hypothetical protein